MIKKVNYKKSLKEYWKLAKRNKFLIFSTAVLIILSSIIGFADKFIFKYLIDDATDFIAGNITASVFSSILLKLAIIYLIIIIIKAIASFFEIKSMSNLVTNLIFKVKEKYFNHIIKLDSSFHSSNKTGSLISKLNRSAGAIDSFTCTIGWDIIPLIVQLLVLVPLFLKFGTIQAMILVGTCIVYFFYNFLLNKKILIDRKKTNINSDREKGFIADIFTNIESVKYFGKEESIKHRFKKLAKKVQRLDLKEWHWFSKIVFWKSIILGVGTIALFGISFAQFIRGILTLGEISFIYTTYLSILGPLQSFTHGIRKSSRHLTDMQGLFKYGDIKKEIKDKPKSKKIKILRGNIKFENIDFKYPKGQEVFKNFNLKIAPGKTVALVGHSGCGKTTLIKLLYRLYDPQKGSIKIDGINIENVQQESLRSEMAIVSQEPILFDDTIYNNIKFANSRATKKEIRNAIKFAQLDEVIEKLPKKEKTIVGERGIKLSGGQKQRVSIARAILANKKILVLDEATSALDSKTEFEIQKDLENLMKNRTSIIIAHRLSTIMKADTIIVLKDGKIEEMGSHRELLSKDGEYSNLWNFQKGGFIQD